MPKVIVEYDMPADTREFELANNGALYYSVLSDVYQYLRELRKYEEREAVPVDEVVSKLTELLSGVDL